MDTELKQFFGDLRQLTGMSDDKQKAAKQVGGDHYLKAIQPWDIIRAWDLNYWEGNIVKYILRHQYKNKLEDIEKAIHYLEFIRDNYEELYESK